MDSVQVNQSRRKIVIDPITRVEGHGKVTIRLDEQGAVDDARFHIIEFRGFERFIRGRMFWEVPVIIQRLCGICPVSHHLTAAKAMDVVVGVDKLTPTAEKIRRLMHYGQVLQSDALHIFRLASPDLLFGFDAPAGQRNIINVLNTYPGSSPSMGLMIRIPMVRGPFTLGDLRRRATSSLPDCNLDGLGTQIRLRFDTIPIAIPPSTRQNFRLLMLRRIWSSQHHQC
jgi:hypothetical protein